MEELRARLQALKITLSSDVEGRIIAHSRSEPLFCVVRENEEEVKEAVKAILTSYITTFYHAHEFDLSFRDAPEARRIPVSSIKPFRELLPDFSGFFGQQRELAAIG